MKQQRILIWSFWGGIFILLIVGASIYFNLHNRSSLKSTPVVQVNEDILTAGEFSEQLASVLEEYEGIMARDSTIVSFHKKRIEETFVQKSLIKQWAKENKIQVTQEELDKEISKVRSSYPDDVSFKEALTQSEQTFSDWSSKIAENLLQKKLFEKLLEGQTLPSEEEMRSFYNSNREMFRVPQQIRVKQVVLANEDTAQRLYHSMDSKTKIEDLARQFSISPEGKNGGDTGWVDVGAMEFLEKASGMRVGQRSQVVKSPFGYHIFELTGKKPETTLTFEEVQNRIQRILISNRENALYSGWLEEQIRNSKIYKNSDILNAIEVAPASNSY